MYVILMRTIVIPLGVNQFLTQPKTYISESEVIVGLHLIFYKVTCMCVFQIMYYETSGERLFELPALISI